MDAVCLDMDGTLVDSERLWDVAVGELAEYMGRPLDRATRERTLGSSLRGFFEILEAYTGHRVDQPEFERLSARLNARVTDLMRTDLTWRPGAEQLLGQLASTGLPVALVTNTEADVAALPIAFLGRSRFDVVVTGDQVDTPKPAPDPYLRACRLLGVDPAATVAVEDSVTGATAAVAAGCRVVYVPADPDQPDVAGTNRVGSLDGLGPSELDRLTATTSPDPVVGG